MMRTAAWAWSAAALLTLVGCGDDSDDTTTSTGAATTSSGAATTSTGGGDTSCADGCAATVAAACSNGPADAPTCESDCNDLRAGSCGTEYEAVLSCSEGKSVTCDGSGLPTVTECAAQFDAFVACLNG